MTFILSQPFFRSIDINALLGRIHTLESRLFRDWEFRATMKLVRNELDKSSKTEMAILGANFAISTELFATMIIVMAVLGATSDVGQHKIDGIDFLVDTSYRIWVMMIELLFFAALWAMCILVWSSANINYMFILELDPHDHYSYMKIFRDASLAMIGVAVLFILYLFEIEGVLSLARVLHPFPWHHGLYHMIPFCIACLVAVCPMEKFMGFDTRLTTRRDLGQTLLEVFHAPFMCPYKAIINN